MILGSNPSSSSIFKRVWQSGYAPVFQTGYPSPILGARSISEEIMAAVVFAYCIVLVPFVGAGCLLKMASDFLNWGSTGAAALSIFLAILLGAFGCLEWQHVAELVALFK